MTPWLDPLGLTPLKLFLALLGWTFLAFCAWAAMWGILWTLQRMRREAIRRRIYPLFLNPENSHLPFPLPRWPGDRGLLLDELLNLGRREVGTTSERIRQELSRPFWLEPELLQMASIRPTARAAACRHLGEIGDKRALPFLLRACQDPFAIVRKAAARALYALDSKAFAALLPRFFSGFSSWRTGEIENVIRDLGRQATPTLQTVLDNSPGDAKRRVIHLLGELADSQAAQMLEALTHSPNARVRTLAVETLKTCYNPAQI